MGLGPIPWTAIDRYCDTHGVRDRERFSALIRGIDAAFLAESSGERQQKREHSRDRSARPIGRARRRKR